MAREENVARGIVVWGSGSHFSSKFREIRTFCLFSGRCQGFEPNEGEEYGSRPSQSTAKAKGNKSRDSCLICPYPELEISQGEANHRYEANNLGQEMGPEGKD